MVYVKALTDLSIVYFNFISDNLREFFILFSPLLLNLCKTMYQINLCKIMYKMCVALVCFRILKLYCNFLSDIIIKSFKMFNIKCHG